MQWKHHSLCTYYFRIRVTPEHLDGLLREVVTGPVTHGDGDQLFG